MESVKKLNKLMGYFLEDSKIITKPWYKLWWGLPVIIGGLVILVVVIFFIFTTSRYIILIKQGKGQDLYNNIHTEGFSKVNTGLKNTEIDSKRSDLEITTAPYLGSQRAKITIVAFMDFKCGPSKAAFPILQKLGQAYGDKIKIIFRNFPAESARPGTTQLSEIAYCIKSDRKIFWPVATLLYNEQENLPPDLSDADLNNIISQFSDNYKSVVSCMAAPKTKNDISKDFIDGVSAGVRGTPTFYINGQKIEGVVPFSEWEKLINKMLTPNT
jgi:protein-disulfide isomerase